MAGKSSQATGVILVGIVVLLGIAGNVWAMQHFSSVAIRLVVFGVTMIVIYAVGMGWNRYRSNHQ